MLPTNIPKSYRLGNYVCSTFKSFYPIMSLHNKTILVDLDVLDDFTTQLMQKKIDKWENVKVKKQFPVTARKLFKEEMILSNKLSEMPMKELDTIFEKLLDENNQHKIFTLLDDCIIYEKSSSDFILSSLLSYFAQAGNTEGIKKVQTLCITANPDYLKANSNFQHYIAEAVWVNGNVLNALEMFEDVYYQNAFLRRRIRLVLRYLIFSTASNRSDAVLVNLINFAENLVKKYNDYYPMMCLWKLCFLSEWFSDQQAAFNLLEKNNGLCKVLASQIPCVVSISLKYHKTEPVYRLLEVFLKYEMKLQYSTILITLFNYKLREGDLRGCCEILNWSRKYKVELPSIQNEKLIKVLLKRQVTENKPTKSISKYDLMF